MYRVQNPEFVLLFIKKEPLAEFFALYLLVIIDRDNLAGLSLGAGGSFPYLALP